MKNINKVLIIVLITTLLISGCSSGIRQNSSVITDSLNNSLGGASQKSSIRVGAKDEFGLTMKQAIPMDMDSSMSLYQSEFNTEDYSYIEENTFKNPKNNPLSTFSIDVDTASYSNVRRFLMNSELPPKDAVRIEELINYFSYDYLNPDDEHPFSVNTEIAKCPWNKNNLLVKIGLKGEDIPKENIPSSNLVFLLDVSGSMNAQDKLPLLQSAIKMLANQLTEKDKISIVVYAGASGVVLDSVSGDDKIKIMDAIDSLNAGGSTNGGEGINLAYKIAKQNFIENGNNRIILATDGDFNVGISSNGELTRLIEEKRNEGIFLTVLGFGTGNIKDTTMETLADKGNGNYAYIDSILEAKKVLVEEMGSTLFTIAKDVKIQVEFNPNIIEGYRLVGYENRKLNDEDFNDDTKDAGEMGAGHTVTAFYELIPITSNEEIKNIDDLKYQETVIKKNDEEIMTVKLRYKDPDKNSSKLLEKIVKTNDIVSNPSEDYMFAVAVTEFGMILRDSKFKGNSTIDDVISLAKYNKGNDYSGYRSEFIKLAELYSAIK